MYGVGTNYHKGEHFQEKTENMEKHITITHEWKSKSRQYRLKRLCVDDDVVVVLVM